MGYDAINGIQWSPIIPTSVEVAIDRLEHWLNADKQALACANKRDLLKAWNALAYLFTGLHPDDGLHNRDTICHSSDLPEAFPDALQEYYEQSGWPVALVSLLDEMWARYENDEVGEEEFYCFNAAKAGIVMNWKLSSVG